MPTAGIVAEYNPLHTGHRFHLTETRKQFTRVIAVMSGHAVQRGGPAAFSKWVRAEAAVRAGADLVLELPAVWASAPAERFAAGAVHILAGTGAVEAVSCGSESGDGAALEQAARALIKAERDPLLPRLLKEGRTYAAAREEAVKAFCGEGTAALLRDPNNILALEYLKAMAAEAEAGHPLSFFTVKRLGAGHDSDRPEGGTASASKLRQMLGAGEDWAAYIPEEIRPLFLGAAGKGEAGADPRQMDRAVLFKLLSTPPESLRQLPDISEGLENRFLKAAEQAKSAEELLGLVKTKRYTLSRLRRILWNLMLGNREPLVASLPPYIRVLAYRDGTGQQLMREIGRKGTLPLYTSMADIRRDFPEIAEVELNATRLFGLCCPEPVRIDEYPRLRPL